MSGKPGPREQIKSAVQRALGEACAATAPELCKELKIRVARLRVYYAAANSDARRRPCDEWLCDNYYVLEKEAKQSACDARRLSKAGYGIPLARLYAAFEAALTCCMPEISRENICLILSEIQKREEIYEKQFEFVPSCIRMALVNMAYTACIETGLEREIAYAVTGIAKLSSIDFDGVVESCSAVERILLGDPAGVYASMAPESRRHYRRLVALIAKATGKSENEAAAEKLAAAGSAPVGPRRHVGFWIIDDKLVTAPRRKRGAAVLTLGALLPVVLSFLTWIFSGSALAAALCFLPYWEIARTPLLHLALAGVEADHIPRMDMSKIKNKPKSVVVVSTLLPKATECEALKDRLRQLYYSNSDPDMYYCVLADFGECDYPMDDKDDSQAQAAKKAVEELNALHSGRFMLFLRSRTYSKTQQRYCGWERKRGAITEFVRFLKDGASSAHIFAGDESVLSSIKYIIALDADTSLLYECAQALISAAVHPLNAPVTDNMGVVVSGYGILVPKVEPDFKSAKTTAFSRLTSGCGGVVAYDTWDKDIYQDLFGESIFSGKGLIDADCFYSLLNDRFPENTILSHDILEGAYLRAGFVSEAVMADAAPSSMGSWLSRLHRWMRGDWQNARFLLRRCRAGGKGYGNPINALSRYKLFDNLRRAFTPAASLACACAALFFASGTAALLAACAVLSVTLPSVWAAVCAAPGGGVFSVSRRFFTRALPRTPELLAQALLFLVMLPAQAFESLDAFFRSLWRVFVSRRRLLEWVTASQSGAARLTAAGTLRRFLLAEVFGLLYFLFTLMGPGSPLALLGLLFALVVPVAYFSAKPAGHDGRGLTDADRDTLYSYNAAMWRYYEDFADASNNFLPPDNVQQSPVFRVATRTSPTNIGMMLLSCLAAKDLGFIDADGLYTRLERTLSTVEKLKRWRGNLLNWYDTVTLKTLEPEFVSSVDSGNFLCCLVALKEGLREFKVEYPRFEGLIERIEAMIQSVELTAFYDEKRHLFSIGRDCARAALVDSYYDFLMSEARLTSFFAVARKDVGKKHWGALGRTMSRQGPYAGPVSWTGTMFEYFMPHLLLPAYDGSLLGEALGYCLYCQKKSAREKGVPWGVSESAFYAFDNELNYQYKAHGNQKLGVKRYLDRELVISPYSTFITIPFNPNSSMRNLREMRELGLYGRYGFFEAADFTESRVGAKGLAVTRSYMAHHIGMSMVASCNALFSNLMQRRFMSDLYMSSASEFLQEKIAKGAVIYDELSHGGSKSGGYDRTRLADKKEETAAIFPQAPRCLLLTNGEITDVLTDAGAGFLMFGGVDFTRRSEDLLRRAQGFFTFVRIGGEFIPATMAPLYEPGVAYSLGQDERSVTYYAKKGRYEVGQRCTVHPTISCGQRQIIVKNGYKQKRRAQVVVYLEPTLASSRDHEAHPAYSKLFVTSRYDPGSKTLVFTRRNRDATQDKFLVIGLSREEQDFSYETARENLMKAPNGFEDMRAVTRASFTCNAGGVPDACCALLVEAVIAPGAQFEATVLAAASRTEAEGIAAIISMRKAGGIKPKNASLSPLLGDSLESRLGGAMLGRLLFTHSYCGENVREKQANTLGQSGLWSLGVSGDLPICLLELDENFDTATVAGYIRLHTSLRALNIQYDICAVFGPNGDGGRERFLSLLDKYSLPSILGRRGGVFALEQKHLAPEILTLLRATARHTAGKPPAPFSAAEYCPIKPVPVYPEPMPEGLAVSGGVFKDGDFYVDRKSPLPYCHILTNPVFGTLVSDSALGFTWAVNSRENKLTPWYNDICTDNNGELLLLKTENKCFDLIKGSRAVFSRENAGYHGRAGAVRCETKVFVTQKGFCKVVELKLENTGDAFAGQLAYYLEPVLHVDRSIARHVSAREEDGAMLLHNPYNTAVKCYAAVRSDRDCVFTNDRAAFLCGDWRGNGLLPTNDPCAAAIVRVKLGPGEQASFRFTLTYGACEAAALFTPELKPYSVKKAENSGFMIDTPDTRLNEFINNFAPRQMLCSRLLGRCAFYQCGGAYGFRDQLQDVAALLLTDPALARRHIIRCCAAQLEEGDVLHWWHALPKYKDIPGSGAKGVRTRFSDDLAWLPLVCAEYVEKTGDISILSLPVGYLSAEPLNPAEQERYISPARSALKEDVFSHCVKALEKAYNLGDNGLPLIGCGDWNDGFSLVGVRGRGTSVWLGMFLAIVFTNFAGLCRLKKQNSLAEEYLRRADGLKKAIDRFAWDGNWYLRAFYDNGGRMGCHESTECSIDLLPQSFAVLADMPDKKRIKTALDSAAKALVDEKLRLVKLFDKPFNTCREQPGYVKAYPPGIRENGGQYTHAAVWFAIALMQAGRPDDGFGIIEMLNPVDRAAHPELGPGYKLEPYCMAADVYTNPHAAGRGGWSAYTGAVSWYYRAVVEHLLGFKLKGDHAELDPRIPSHWESAGLTAKVRGAEIKITIARGGGPRMLVDGEAAESILLDGKDHAVKITLKSSGV